MITSMGKKIFFINPTHSLRDEFLENIFKNEFELYLLEGTDKLDKLLKLFPDVIIFINIDLGMSHSEWIEFIRDLKKRHNNCVIGVFSKSNSSSLSKTLLYDIGITGGYIVLEQDNWKSAELINRVLEANEARGRRKNVRLDFHKNESRNDLNVKIFTELGFNYNGVIESCSSRGILVSLSKREIKPDDNVTNVLFTLKDVEFHITGYLLKRFEGGKYFISFEDISSYDKELIQSYIFDSLQKSFAELLNKL